MKNLMCLLFTMLVFTIFTPSQSYAAFPIKAKKIATIQASENLANREKIVVQTTVQTKVVKQTSFLHRLIHPTDSVFGLFSLLSLVFGAIGLIVAFFTAAGFALGLAAVVLGAIGLYMGSEKMMATLGLILGIVAIVVALIV